MSSLSLAILSFALSFMRSSKSDVLNLPMNSYQSIFPSELASILAINLSISLDVSPRLSFLNAFLNSTSDMNPFLSSSNSLNISSKLFDDVLIICLNFSNISTSHVELDELYVYIVVLAPGGADLSGLTAELPEYLRFSKCDLNWNLSSDVTLFASVRNFHKFYISFLLNLSAVNELIAYSNSL
jgi:hypothetical protein